MNILEWINQWFLSHCDGDWEHENIIQISTTSNPGLITFFRTQKLRPILKKMNCLIRAYYHQISIYSLEYAADYYPYGKVLREFQGLEEKYGYQGSEKDEELGDEMYYTLFRHLDTDIARWTGVDPEFRPMYSPFSSMGGNPVLMNDPLGDLEDEYGVNKSGKIKLLRKTNDNFDRLYKIDENGTKVDIHKQGSHDDFVVVYDQNILKSLAEGENGAPGKIGVVTNNEKDANKLFYFLANNSSVEWMTAKYNDGAYALGSYKSIGAEKSPSPENSFFGNYKLTDVKSHIHSHPPVSESFNTDYGRRWSMGGDEVGFESRPNKESLNYYVYFPKQRQIYQITHRRHGFYLDTVKSYWGVLKLMK